MLLGNLGTFKKITFLRPRYVTSDETLGDLQGVMLRLNVFDDLFFPPLLLYMRKHIEAKLPDGGVHRVALTLVACLSV
jgi:hypothetical protein